MIRLRVQENNITLGKVEVAAEAEKPAGSPRLSEATVKVKVSANAKKKPVEAAWNRTKAKLPSAFNFQSPNTIKSGIRNNLKEQKNHNPFFPLFIRR